MTDPSVLGPDLGPQGTNLVLPLPSRSHWGTGTTSLRGQSLAPSSQEPRGMSPGQVPDTE